MIKSLCHISETARMARPRKPKPSPTMMTTPARSQKRRGAQDSEESESRSEGDSSGEAGVDSEGTKGSLPINPTSGREQLVQF